MRQKRRMLSTLDENCAMMKDFCERATIKGKDILWYIGDETEEERAALIHAMCSYSYTPDELTEMLSFADYAEGFFKDTARRQALRVLANDAAPEQLADFFSEINAAYFAGHMDLFIVDEQILSRWQRQTAFLARYLDSIVQEPRRNHCELTIDY